MSKVSKLKQEAYQASKKRDWDKVIKLYERILELEKNNPALSNELGDTYLKRGQIPRAIEHFLSAAEKYRVTGLLSNAVAICKKVLRFDAGNLSAHWLLAELRASQKLYPEAIEHARSYLGACERISPEFREGYLKRCVKMLASFGEQAPVLERLAEVFAFWDQPLEAARAALLRHCLRFDGGDVAEAEAAVAALLAEREELAQSPEHAAWRRRHGEAVEPADATAYADVNSIELEERGGGEPAGVGAAARTARPGAAAGPRGQHVLRPGSADGSEAGCGESGAEDAAGSLAQSLGLVDLAEGAEAVEPDQAAAVESGAGIPLGELDSLPRLPEGSATSGGPAGAADGADAGGLGAAAAPEPVPRASMEEWGEQRYEISLDDTPTLDALTRALAGETGPAAPETAGPTDGAVAETPAASQGSARAPEAPVDLLAEILADEAPAGGDAEAAQLDTIATEIGQRVGGATDPAGQYDLGLVYLEMEMLDQAADCFAAAVTGPDHALRSYEMWGIVLIRQTRYEDAVDILGRGLRTPGARPTDLLGLLYHTGEAYERAGRSGAAREYYERVYQLSPSFLDTEKRLEALESH